MAVEHTHLNIIRAETVRISEIIVRTRQIIAAAKELLSWPAPSTFLGGRTRGPPWASQTRNPVALLPARPGEAEDAKR